MATFTLAKVDVRSSLLQDLLILMSSCIFDILNKFHENIKFTYEVEHNGKISFSDVLLMRCHGKLETTVFRKETT